MKADINKICDVLGQSPYCPSKLYIPVDYCCMVEEPMNHRELCKACWMQAFEKLQNDDIYMEGNNV